MRIEKMLPNKYLPIYKIGFFTMMTYRWECVFAALSSLLMIGFMYFLWGAIFLGADNHNLLGFETTFIYVAMGIAILVTFNSSADVHFTNILVSGDIIRELIRPLSIHLKSFINALGIVGFRFCLVFIPSFILVFVLVPTGYLTALNLILFFCSLLGSLLILFHIDMIVAMISFRTEASWGIRLAKDYFVMLLSGALIPFHFLPESVRQVFMYLPFQSICHTPLYILTHKTVPVIELLELILVQAFWCLILIFLVRFLMFRMIEKIEIYGG